jgi:single-stranded-DNA-specific exonuclease
MKKRWVIKKPAEPQQVMHLVSVLGIDEALASLLVQRGIVGFDEAKTFFRPSLEQLHDPFLMKDMDKAVARLKEALTKGQKILVYGDYDVDGTTSVALVYSYLKSFYTEVDYYIPDRYAEGYGISFQGIDFAAENNFSLIIALDCGIKSNDKIDYANSKGIDFVICDHHLPGETIPAASAVLDPKRADCPYPYKELSGCGIGFKLVQAYAQAEGIDFTGICKEIIDLVAVSIASDIVPITGENRILAFYGLKELSENPRPGIKALLEISKYKNEEQDKDKTEKKTEGPLKPKALNISDIVFVIGPRINAAGRISTGRKAVAMLISKTPEIAVETGKIINEHNKERKELDNSITQQALEMISSNESLQNKKTTVLFHKDWHKGVIGIVASRLIENYYRPTVLFAESNGMATGSARSVKDFDVHNAIEMCSDLLEQFGGHKYAAGLTLKLENIDAFAQKFEQVVSEQIEDHLLIPQIEIDTEIKLNVISDKFYRIVQQMSPFGPENMTPVFCSSGLSDFGSVRIVGTNHLKMDVAHVDNENIRFPAIGFNMVEFFDVINKGIPFSACYTIEENHFKGRTTLQLNIRDIKIS